MKGYAAATSVVNLSHQRPFVQGITGQRRIARGTPSGASSANSMLIGTRRPRGIEVDLQTISYLGDRYYGAFHFGSMAAEVPRGWHRVFTKWIEAKPVAQITAHKVQHFVWKNIVCRFGIPKRLVSDNGTQFAS